jgi:hypothetical protein
MLALETHSVESNSSVSGEDYRSRVVLGVGRQVTRSKSQILISGLLGWAFLNESQRPQPSQTFEFALTKLTRHRSQGNRGIFEKIEHTKENKRSES